MVWDLKQPQPVKLIVGILAADSRCLEAAEDATAGRLGQIDLLSDIWPFTQTDYYEEQAGSNILRRFVSIEKLVDPGTLAEVKHTTNEIEQELARRLSTDLSRPVNLDPGFVEPSKLVLATTKNYSHRIYIGNMMYAEVTLVYDKGAWQPFDYTYPDYCQQCYLDFFTKVRQRLLEQLKT